MLRNAICKHHTVGTGVTIQSHGGVSIAGLTTANGGVQVGSAMTIAANGNLAVTGIVTAKEFVGVFTSAGGAGVGIDNHSTGLVGYGFTFINFNWFRVLTLYLHQALLVLLLYSSKVVVVRCRCCWNMVGISDIGIHTAKSVGVNTKKPLMMQIFKALVLDHSKVFILVMVCS